MYKIGSHLLDYLSITLNNYRFSVFASNLDTKSGFGFVCKVPMVCFCPYLDVFLPSNQYV